jgi:hypothetical protein
MKMIRLWFSQSVRTGGDYSTHRRMLAIVTALAAAAGGGATAFGSTLYSIGVLNPTNAYSEVRAVSQDGTYVAGVSTSAGAYHTNGSTVFSPANTNAPVVWSVADALVELPNPNNTHCIAIGVDVGFDPTNGVNSVNLAGLHEKATVSRCYKAPLTSLGSGRWFDTAAAANVGWGSASCGGGAYNNLRFKPGGSGRWVTGIMHAGRIGYVLGDPYNAWDGDSSINVVSISGFSMVVGRYTGVSPSTARYENSGLNGDVPNSSGSRADGFGISCGFGTNATDYGSQWVCGQVQNYNGPATTMQAFRWNRADGDMTYLGSLAPAGGGDLGNNSSVAYTIADNGVTGGRSYFGAISTNVGYEVATVWDTSGTWDTSGVAQSLQALLAADGVDTSAWTQLVRVYAASNDGKVLAGFGIWAADNSTRGFVAIKTPTAPVVLLTNINVTGTTVTLDFTSSSASDTTASFSLQNCEVVNGTYADIAASFSGSAGSFQATLTSTNSVQFYRIRHQ